MEKSVIWRDCGGSERDLIVEDETLGGGVLGVTCGVVVVWRQKGY